MDGTQREPEEPVERPDPDEPVEPLTPTIPPPNVGMPLPPYGSPDVGDERSA